MSASPENFDSAKPQSTPSPGFPRPEHRDLETLLALSSLHEQIRRRRAQELNKGARLSREDAWELKQLVHDEVLQLIADRALIVTGADGVAVALVDGNGIVCRASAGKIAPERGTRLDPASGFSGACLRTGEVVRCDDSEKDTRVSSEACQRLGTRSMVAVPLSTPRAIVGVLEAFSTEAYGFNDSDVRSLMVLGELILDAMKPEDEDLLAEISQRVVSHDPGQDAAQDAKTASPSPGQAESVEEDSETRSEAQLPVEVPRSPDWTFQIKAPVIWQEEPAIAKSNTKLVFFSEAEQPDDSRPGLRLVVLLILLATALGVGLWWQIRHSTRLANRQTAQNIHGEAKPVSGAAIPLARSSPQADSVADASSPESDINIDTGAASGGEKSGQPQVTGIRHWSSADSSTVVIDLEDQVQYEAHRLTDPERIYFDLLDTKLAHGLYGTSIEVNDGLLQRIRIAQPKPGVTRVVLDTQGASNYAVSLESSPYRLVVEVGKLGSKLGPKARLQLFAPNDQVQATANSTPRPAVNPAGESESNAGNAAADAATAVQVSSQNPARVPGQTNTKPSAGATIHASALSIVLDAGHGGWDLGTVGRQGLQEKDLVLDIVQRLGGLLRRRLNADVIYTRQDDSYIPLEKRAEIANLSRAQLFLSVHANYSELATARGVETYYSNTYSSAKARPEEDDASPALQNINWTKVNIREKVHQSHRFADCVQEALFGIVEAKNPGIRDRGVKQADYVVLTGTSMPAILTEVSFVSSPTDENELQKAAYRQRIAEALYKGIARYEEVTRRTTMAGLVGKPAR